MKICISIAVILTTLLIPEMNAQEQSDNKAVSSQLNIQKLAGGFKFTEGPAADKDGNIYFTDIPNNRIHKWSVEKKLSTFMENTGGANGLFFDRDGNLIACAGGTGKLVSIDLQQGKTTVIGR